MQPVQQTVKISSLVIAATHIHRLFPQQVIPQVQRQLVQRLRLVQLAVQQSLQQRVTPKLLMQLLQQLVPQLVSPKVSIAQSVAPSQLLRQ